MPSEKSKPFIGGLTKSTAFWNSIKILPIILTTSALVGCFGQKNNQMSERSAAALLAKLSEQEKKKGILDNLKSKGIYDGAHDQWFVIDTLPSDKAVRSVAAENNIFFASPTELYVSLDDPEMVKGLTDLGFEVILQSENKIIGVNTYLLKNLTDVQSAKTLLEDRSTKSTHIKEIVVGKDTHHLTYPSIDYVTNMWQSACVNWSDTYANRGSLTGEHSLYLDEQPWIDNGMFNVPTVGQARIQSLISLASTNQARFNTIDGGANLNHAEFIARNIYGFNTSNNTATQSPDDHGTATLELGAGQMNNAFASLGTGQRSQTRVIDAGGGGSLLSPAVYAGNDSINNRIASDPNAGQVLSCSFSGPYDAVSLGKAVTFGVVTGGKGIIIVSSGNSGNSTMNPLAERPYTRAIGATDTQDPARSRWTGSSYGGTPSAARHVFAMGDGYNTGIPNVSRAYSQGAGTSYSTPIVAGVASTYQKFFPNHTFAETKESFQETTYDLEGAGYNITTGYGYARGDKAIIYGSSMSMPATIDAAGNPLYTFAFTPETINGSTLLADTLRYPNGQLVPYTVSGGTYTYNIRVNTNNGFINGVNQCTYKVKAPNGCIVDGKTRKITVSNVATLVITPIKILDYNTKVVNGNDVVNEVRTSQEQNSRDFILERSSDGLNFSQVGATLPAAGNSSDTRSYSITDHNVPAGTWYYRFKETDLDGKTTYTKTNHVTIKNLAGLVTIYPNPAWDIIKIRGDVKQVIIEDMTGKRIKNIYVNGSVNNPASVDVSDLASGTYRVLIVATDKSIAHQPLIIAR